MKSVPLTSADIRARFLEFFVKRGHLIIPSASLVTSDEKGITNATLFNSAGIQPLVPYLLGKPYLKDGSEITRLVDVQKCLRTVDIDEIGDRTHATFFEMLGNWSLGDYFKKEAITWSYEFLTNPTDGPVGDRGLGLDPNRLYVTVFEGDNVAPRDDEAAGIWHDVFAKHGIFSGGDTSGKEAGRIFYLPAVNNWWEAGENGPCGPDSEMFYDISNRFGGRVITKDEYLDADQARDVIEVWNDVFMQYEKKEGKIVGKLPKPSVDTGAGLERLTMTLEGVDNIYDTDLLKAVHTRIQSCKTETPLELKSSRIVADHVRASMFLIMDGVIPSNTDRGYILRRFIRRAAFLLRPHFENTVGDLVNILTEVYAIAYPQMKNDAARIADVMKEEAVRFSHSLEDGLKQFERTCQSYISRGEKTISGVDAFQLFQSYGFPIDLSVSLASSKGLGVDTDGYKVEFKKHQELSRAGAEQKFKGGLADANDPMVVRYHTATHLLHQALHDVLGDGVMQKGSNITPERLRFDFSYGAKMTDEQKKKVEEIVNARISEALPMNQVTMSKSEAEKTGSRHFFGEKYGESISIYFVGNDLDTAYSKEFCGGPHVKNTKELAGPEGTWHFKIQKEEAVAQGVRRIKALLG